MPERCYTTAIYPTIYPNMVEVAQSSEYGDATAIVNGRSIESVTFNDDIVVTFRTLSLTIKPGSITDYDENEYTDVAGVPGVCVKRSGDILRFDSASCPEFWCEVRVVRKCCVYQEC